MSTFPSRDIAFRRAVEVVLATSGHGISEQRLAVLRSLYPDAMIVPSALSDHQLTYYAYRDGRFGVDSSEPWWERPGVARARLSIQTGLLVDTTDDWADLMGAPASHFIGRHFLELVQPQARETAAALFEAVLRNSDIRSRIIVQRADGQPLAVEFRALADGNEVLVFYRPAPPLPA